MKRFRFSIIIVTWNALHHLKNYLASVTATDYPDYEILIADNASDDGTGEWVRKNFPGIRVVRLDKNYGYCGGNNRAAKKATGDILLFLNNDVEVTPGWLKHLNKTFQDNPDVAVVQPKLRAHANREYFEYAGAAGGFLDKYGYPFCRGRILDNVEKDNGQYDEPSDIFWASGAAFAIRKDLFELMNGFDEDFGFHMEEIDLCWRLWNRGYRVRYCPESVVYHLGGGSLAMGSPRKVYYNFRNNLIMFWKNATPYDLLTKFPVRYKLDIIAFLRTLLTFNLTESKAILRAHIHFWRRFSVYNNRRQHLLSRRTIPDNPKTLIPISIIWQYYVRHRRTFDKLKHPEHE
jgi:GT2 family glycosyltransferase